ncbi:MAG: hypothetical protein HKP17_09055 [Ignavibacteriaceae bacterium]|nr:hypothetical protein [Ignavibacteriaceae bacterium]
MKRFLYLNIILIFAFLLANTSAQNYNDALILSEPGFYTSARALSLGNSYTSMSNDFSGVLFNPAGIGLVKNVQLSGGMNFNAFSNSTTFFNSQTNSSKNAVSLNQFGIIYPIPTLQGSWVFAIGYNRVKDFNRTLEFDGFNNGNTSMIQDLTGEFNEQIPITNDLGLAYEIRDPNTDQYIRDTTLIDGLLNQSGRIRRKGNIGKWSFSSSVEVARGFFIGGTFNILSGSFKSDKDYWEDDTGDIYGAGLELVPGDPTTRDFQSFYLNDIIEWNLSGWDANLGVLYSWQNRFRFGASVKFPSYFTVKETYYVDATSDFGVSSGYALQPIVDKIEYGIRTPFEYALGASGTFSIVTLSGDIKIIDYTQMDFNKGFDSQYRIERKREIEDLFTTVVNLHAGAEFKFPQTPVLGRFGVMYLPSQFEGDPSEFDKKYLTAGVGVYLANMFKIDVAYAYGWWEDFGDNYGVNASRTLQDITVNNFIVNFIVNL